MSEPAEPTSQCNSKITALNLYSRIFASVTKTAQQKNFIFFLKKSERLPVHTECNGLSMIRKSPAKLKILPSTNCPLDDNCKIAESINHFVICEITTL